MHQQLYLVGILVLVILVVAYMSKKSENMVSFSIEKAVGDKSYVHFYDDFVYNNLLFKMEQSEMIKYIKYDLKGDAKSMDINLVDNGRPGQMVEVWARYPFSNVGTTVSDYYNAYPIPEYNYPNMTNLKLVARILPGQRFRSDNIVPSKRFLVKAIL